MNTKVFLIFVLVVLVAAGAYFYLRVPAAQAPASDTSAVQQQPSAPASASSPTEVPANVGATEVSNPDAPAGSAAQCAQCDEYQGAQKAQCLVALNCQ